MKNKRQYTVYTEMKTENKMVKTTAFQTSYTTTLLQKLSLNEFTNTDNGTMLGSYPSIQKQ